LSARRLALAAYGGLALFEFAETLAYLWIQADLDRAAGLADMLGVEPETALTRVHILLPVASILTLIASLVFLGVRAGASVALRWRRTAFIAFSLYALWALLQQLVLIEPTVAARLWLGTVSVIAGGLGVLGYLSVAREMAAPGQPRPFELYDPLARVERSDSGLEWQDIEVGKGPLAFAGRTAVVHYTGWLTDGRKFDSSLDRRRPFEFTVGHGRVVKGWDEGIQTMRQGGRRRLIVPPDLAYGSSGAGIIPPGAPLVFEIDLVDVR
jgi:FKBP-type peptidyl-prolyl cis-trans isomerase FkpA